MNEAYISPNTFTARSAALPRGQVPTLTFEKGTLLLKHCSAALLTQKFSAVPWQWDDRVGQWRCDAIYYPLIRATIVANDNFVCRDLVPVPPCVVWSRNALPSLRLEQRAAVTAWLQTRRGVITMPTGTGKTDVALALMRETATATLVVCPVRDLLYQWHQRIQESLGYDAGIIGDNTFNLRPVSVTTYESACIHMPELGTRFNLLIFDECHHLPGPIRRDAALMSIAAWRLGLTATLERSDGRHHDLDHLIGPVVFNLPFAAARGQTLADYEIVRIPVHLAASEQRLYDQLATEVRQFIQMKVKENPDYTWQDLCAEAGEDLRCRRAQQAFYTKTAIEERALEKFRVLEDLFRLHAGEPVIVFTGTNAMARDISLRFLIPCLLSHCRKNERREILDGFRQGRYPAIVANQVLDEGVDIPAAKVAIVVGGQASTRQAKQRLGRILRKHANTRAVLYEVVCAETHEELRSRQRRKNDAYPRARHRRL